MRDYILKRRLLIERGEREGLIMTIISTFKLGEFQVFLAVLHHVKGRIGKFPQIPHREPLEPD